MQSAEWFNRLLKRRSITRSKGKRLRKSSQQKRFQHCASLLKLKVWSYDWLKVSTSASSGWQNRSDSTSWSMIAIIGIGSTSISGQCTLCLVIKISFSKRDQLSRTSQNWRRKKSKTHIPQCSHYRLRETKTKLTKLRGSTKKTKTETIKDTLDFHSMIFHLKMDTKC